MLFIGINARKSGYFAVVVYAEFKNFTILPR